MNKHKTLKNKLYASLLLIAGIIPAVVYKDATFLVFSAGIGLPLFFAKDNWIY